MVDTAQTTRFNDYLPGVWPKRNNSKLYSRVKRFERKLLDDNRRRKREEQGL